MLQASSVCREGWWQPRNFARPSQMYKGERYRNIKFFRAWRKPCVSLGSHHICASRSHLDGSEPIVASAPIVSCLLLKCSQKFILRLARPTHFTAIKKGRLVKITPSPVFLESLKIICFNVHTCFRKICTFYIYNMSCRYKS